MSQASLTAFLEKLLAELEREPNFRRNVADKRPHTFRISKQKLISEITKELKAREIDVSSELKKIVSDASGIFVSSLSTKLGKLASSGEILVDTKTTKLTKTNIVFSFVTLIDTPAGLKPWEKNYADPSITFDRIKLEYDELFQTLFDNIKEGVKAEGQKLQGTKGKFLQLSHELEKGIFETQLAEAYNAAVGTLVKEAGANPAALSSDLQKLGLENLSIRRDGTTGEMEVFLGSKSVNLIEGVGSGSVSTIIRNKIREILDSGKIGNLADLEGSDSIRTRSRKKAGAKVMEPFKKIKGATVKSEDFKINAKTTSKSKKVAGKAAAGGKATLTAKKVRARTSVTSAGPSGAQMAQLLGILNSQLPRVVAANMRPPALQYQTGRFAASVRATDITTTAQGFPSIGYTYMRNPYETFEVGNQQGSVDRDPRRLIEQSIREIAVSMAIGRFYTRRQ